MKKTLLLCAAALCSLMASAGDGLTPVGANLILLPSSQWDVDIEWKAMTWVYNSGEVYGDPYNESNPNYNNVLGEPWEDAEGHLWYEPGFDMSPKYDEGSPMDFNIYTQEEILWEEHTAPFSSDATSQGHPCYQWSTNNIIADIYVRRTFTIPAGQMLAGPVYLACGHDDAPAEYYINGELVFEVSDGWENGKFIQLSDEQKALIKLNGEENLIAFHVHQNWGGCFADCGLYTKLEGGLDMGYTTPWEGKVLFNSTGGYNNDLQSPSNNPRHPWSALYEAQEGDEYTFTLNGSCEDDIWMEMLQFKTAIKIEEGRFYNFKARVLADKPINALLVQLGDNDNADVELAYEEHSVKAPQDGEEDYEGELIDIDFEGQDVSNFMLAFDFGGGEDTTKITIKDITLKDVSADLDEDKELWVGTHYFNFFNMHKMLTRYYIWDETLNDGEGDYREANLAEYENADETEKYEEEELVEMDAPEIEGRVETLAWTQVDFDDSMWDDQMMPTGSSGYMAELQSIWPNGVLPETGYSSNYWIRRNFELDKVNERLSYELNVCHDDVYETYVNGHLLQKNVGWTNGKTPVQVHIPAKYLNVGKNVIATYIQQNWGGFFYDCGINVTEVNYDECLKMFNDALAYAKTDTLLTNAMKDDVKALIAEATEFFNENKSDAAELRNYAREFRPRVDAIFAYSKDVKTLKDTYYICRKMEDKGFWGTSLDDVTTALDICRTSDELRPYINAMRDARKATAMERHTEKYKGCVPQVVPYDMIGLDKYEEYDEEEDDDITKYNPTYYLYNVGTKLFLGAGEAWGAHLAVQFASNPMMIVQATKEAVDELGEVIYDVETGEPVRTNIEGGYFIESFRPNGAQGQMDFVNWNGFIDCPANETSVWEFVPVEGKENVFHICQYGQKFDDQVIENEDGTTTFVAGGKKMLGLRSGDNAFAPSYYIVDTDMRTPELETNQWMFISREEMLSFIGAASETNPADLTFLIENPGYDQRLTIDNWIFNNDGGNVSVFGRNDNKPNFTFEAYNAAEFDMTQNLRPREGKVALPAGTYMLTVQGYYRDGNEEAHLRKVVNKQPVEERALLFAGPTAEDESGNFSIDECHSMPLMPIHIEANKYPGIGYTYGGMSVPGTYGGQPYSACDQAARDYFPSGLYLNKVVFTVSEEDAGKLSLGIYKPYDDVNPVSGDWCVMDNWRLWYYGNGDIDPVAISEVESDEIVKDAKAQKGIYNMLGQRMSKTQKGVNIVGGKKIIKK